MRSRRIVFAILGAMQLATACVDGVTPDCSDAAACAPSYPGYVVVIPPIEASVDASTDAEAGVSDAADAADVRADVRDARGGG